MATRFQHLLTPVGLLLACGACAAEATTPTPADLELSLDTKADGSALTLCLDDPIELAGTTNIDDFQSLSLGVTAEAFRVQLTPVGEGGAPLARIVVAEGGRDRVFGLGSPEPEVSVDRGPGRRRFSVRVENLGAEALAGRLCFTAMGATEPDPTEPELEVRFTRPVCRALSEHGIEQGIFCEEYEDRERSRRAVGILDRMIEWILDARDAADAGKEVTLTMAYLSWSDARLYDALCQATRAGVRFEGFFDSGTQGTQPPAFLADASCRAPGQDNIAMRTLGGHTYYNEETYEREWRLMHIKLMMFEVEGEPTTRLLFGSANVSSSATSVHFENWVFAKFPAESHFVASHRCAREALVAASEKEYPADAPEFNRALGECLGAIETDEDPRYRVLFSPDDAPEYISGGLSSRSMRALIDEMQGAERTVSMAVQHFSALALASQLRWNGNDPDITTRLVLDDDTFYHAGESGSDWDVYSGYVMGSGIDTRFLQTNRGRYQYQHNKYVLVDDEVVFCGAGNFTEAAFIDNYENFYFIRDPEVVQQYVAHFGRLNGLAKSPDELPESAPTVEP